MKNITIFITILFSFGLYAQTDKLIADSKDFISESVNIFESNPTHLNESVSIDSCFHIALLNYPNCKLDTCYFTSLLLENAETSYEDTQDSYRHEIRRCMIYSLFAMSVQSDKSELFLELAEKSLLSSNGQIDFRNNEAFAGILILQLLLKDTNETLMSYEIDSIREKYKKLDTLISKEIFSKGLQIIEAFGQKINNNAVPSGR